MEQSPFRRELSKWWLAVVRSATISDSAKLLWIGTLSTSLLLVACVIWYQWTQHEISALPPTVKPSGSFFKFSLSAAAVVSLTALTVLGSLLAAFLVILLEKVKWEASLIDRASFLAILARNPFRDPLPLEEMFNIPIDIVVPRYRYSFRSPRLGDDDKRRKILVEVGGTTREWKKDLSFNDIEDGRAAQRVQAELDKLRFTNVVIRNDTDLIQPEREKACQILIGLRVNSRVNSVLDEQPEGQELVAVNEIKGSGGFFSVALATTGPQGISAPPSDDRVYRDKQGQLVLLIAKFCSPTSTRLVVGGLSDHGTLLAADAFSDRLLELARAFDTASKKQVDSNGFAAVLTSSGERFAVPALQELPVP